ncbi:MAG: hypothetical protein LBB08_01405 [Rickettsiales bacterium]|jgi:hypothetical protein|nr:hypothetical protein [Rickettsiales bacterium]
MRRLIGFFAGVAIAALLAASLRLCVYVYEYAGAQDVQGVLLQESDLRRNRIPAPERLSGMPDDYIRDRLIGRFVSLYFGVVPIRDEPESRGASNGALKLMMSKAAMDAWRLEVLPELQSMAASGKMRRVHADFSAVVKKGVYLVVPVKLLTWEAPNDFSPPAEASVEMYLRLRFNKRVRKAMGGRKFDAGRWLDAGNPPTAVFEFIVDEVAVR